MIRRSQFKPSWWLRNAHMQTIYPVLMRPYIKLNLREESFDFPDGDHTDICWINEKAREQAIVVIFHGITGSVESQYVRGLLRQCQLNNWCGVLMHFRGASGKPNRLPRNYYAGDSDDAAVFVNSLAKRFPKAKIAAAGFSLGGSVLLKWLGETGARNPLTAAVAISVPFDLQQAAFRVNQGFSKIYQWRVLNDLRRNLLNKYATVKAPVDVKTLKDISNMYDFDTTFTAPLHGFKSAYDYYSKTSSRQFLKKIRIPTLIIQAADDPLLGNELVVYPQELSPSTILEFSPKGGHVGFVTGNNPFKPVYWLEKRIPEYFSQAFAQADQEAEREKERRA